LVWYNFRIIHFFVSGKTVYRIGTAGWGIPPVVRAKFPQGAGLSQLQKYSQRFNAVEINSSFYRDHKAQTYARWAATVPHDFRFSVKLARQLTHHQRLVVQPADIKVTLEPIFELGQRLGCILVQLPPSLDFEAKIAERFFRGLRKVYSGLVVVEARHATWEKPSAENVLREHGIERVFADPPAFSSQRLQSSIYYRLHGSPEMYRSKYDDQALDDYARKLLQQKARNVWCIFDNSTLGHATTNALEMKGRAKGSSARRSRASICHPGVADKLNALCMQNK
jgi:uncharacterized protein YecE (DUF72 family)